MKNIFLCTIAIVCLCLCSCEQAHISPPITIEMRQSWVRGLVLQITNRSTEHLECRVYASDNIKQSKTFRFVLRSGETQEIGHLELDGWYLDPGEYAIISVKGYLQTVKVKWDSDGRYSWENI